MIKVSPSNDQPQFEIYPKVTVLQDSGCVSNAIFWGGLSGAKCDRQEPRRHVRAGFATNITVGDLFEAGTADICASNPSACQMQSWSFTVEPILGNNSTSVDLFARQPQISWNGTLSFILKEFRTGSASFRVSMRDDGQEPRMSKYLFFTIEVLNINEAPTFHVPARVVAFEDVLFEHVALTDVSAGNFEDNQSMSFSVTVDDPKFFAEQPTIVVTGNQGRLRFIPRKDVFGTTQANITLTDNGGTDFGGQDTTTKWTVLDIFPVNEAPNLDLAKDVFVFESELRQQVPGLINTSTVGPNNENGVCSMFPGDCESQAIEFMFDYASNPNLFLMLPRLEKSGLLSFQLCKGCSGVSSVCFRAKDDGGIVSEDDFPMCTLCSSELRSDHTCCRAPILSPGTDTSVRSCLSLHAEPIDIAPAFRFSWDVNCTHVDAECFCWDAVTAFAQENYTQNQVCQPRSSGNSLATVRVLEDAGQQQIHHFASGISSANGHVTSS